MWMYWLTIQKWYADCCIAVKYFSKNFNLNLIDGDTVIAVAIGIEVALGGDELLPDSAIDCRLLF